jgi:SnoaL-like domain
MGSRPHLWEALASSGQFSRDPPRLLRVTVRSSLRDTQPAMPEESTTPDLVERTLGQFEAADHGDFDAIMSCWASDAVWDMSPMGLGLYEGAAIRRLFRMRYASVLAWVGGLIVRFTTTYIDVDEARAAAERLAEERG